MSWGFENLDAHVAYALDRCVTGPVPLPAQLRPLAHDVVKALLLAGLPVFDVEQSAEGEDNGVELTIVESSTAAPCLGVAWRLHASAVPDTEPGRAVRTMMHAALRVILTVHGLDVSPDTPPSEPLLLPAPEPARSNRP